MAGFVGIFFASCQREVDFDLPPDPNPAVNDSTLLWKYIELDTTFPTGSDTLYKTVFFYDNRKRVTGYNDYDFTIPGSTGIGIRKYFYNGNDTIPYKTIYNYQETNYIVADTIYYFYNNGLVSSDSGIHYRNSFAGGNNFEELFLKIRSFTNTGNNTIIDEKVMDYLPVILTCQSTITAVKTYANGNIIAEQNSSTGCVTGVWSNQFTYDNKINPLYKTDIHYSICIEQDESFGAQKNNPTQSISSLNNNNPVQYIYTYRSDNYPVIVRVNDIANPSNNFKGLFFYTQ